MRKLRRIAIWQRTRIITVDPDNRPAKPPASDKILKDEEPATLDNYRYSRDTTITRMFGEQNLKRA